MKTISCDDAMMIDMHEPYRVSDEYRDEISTRQRIKGAIKYPELFDPDSHTDEELSDHAMMEFHDGQEYVAGMRTRMRQLRGIIMEKDAEIAELKLLLKSYMKGEAKT